LLANAIKYSQVNTTIELWLEIESNQAIFQVKDQGIGIPPEDLPHLFTSFHRGQNIGNIPGTGLGLSIVKNYIDVHRGKIKVASTLGEGTTFTITIPLDQEIENHD
jgi:signal transduction histidine kinase